MKLRYLEAHERKDSPMSVVRPKEITAEQWRKIACAMKLGADLHTAAAYARISYGRLYRNIEAGKHLRRDVNEIMAKCKLHHLRRVYKGEKGWQSSAWFLERMYRSEFALHNDLKDEEERAIQVRKVIRRQGPMPGKEQPPSDN